MTTNENRTASRIRASLLRLQPQRLEHFLKYDRRETDHPRPRLWDLRCIPESFHGDLYADRRHHQMATATRLPHSMAGVHDRMGASAAQLLHLVEATLSYAARVQVGIPKSSDGIRQRA